MRIRLVGVAVGVVALQAACAAREAPPGQLSTRATDERPQDAARRQREEHQEQLAEARQTSALARERIASWIIDAKTRCAQAVDRDHCTRVPLGASGDEIARCVERCDLGRAEGAQRLVAEEVEACVERFVAGDRGASCALRASLGAEEPACTASCRRNGPIELKLREAAARR